MALESVIYVLAICVTNVYQFLKRPPCNFSFFMKYHILFVYAICSLLGIFLFSIIEQAFKCKSREL